MSSPITPAISTTAPTSKINRRKFICLLCPTRSGSKPIETILRPACAGRHVDEYVVLVRCGGRGPKGVRRFGRPWSCGVARRARRGVPGDRLVVRQRATMDVPQEHGVSSVMLLTLLRRPLWRAGTAAAVAGYVFQALALADGSLLLVQPI